MFKTIKVIIYAYINEKYQIFDFSYKKYRQVKANVFVANEKQENTVQYNLRRLFFVLKKIFSLL